MAALVAMPLPAQMPPRAPSPGDIVVEGRGQEKPPQQIARDFTHTPPEEQIARWRSWLCIDILGIPDDRANYIRGRMAENAKGAGLKVISGKCTWNILIEFPADADAATRQLIKDHPERSAISTAKASPMRETSARCWPRARSAGWKCGASSVRRSPKPRTSR